MGGDGHEAGRLLDTRDCRGVGGKDMGRVLTLTAWRRKPPT